MVELSRSVKLGSGNPHWRWDLSRTWRWGGCVCCCGHSWKGRAKVVPVALFSVWPLHLHTAGNYWVHEELGAWGRLDNGPERYPSPNPWNLWISPRWQTDFADGIKLRILDRKGILGYLVHPKCNHMGPNKREVGDFDYRRRKEMLKQGDNAGGGVRSRARGWGNWNRQGNRLSPAASRGKLPFCTLILFL